MSSPSHPPIELDDATGELVHEILENPYSVRPMLPSESERVLLVADPRGGVFIVRSSPVAIACECEQYRARPDRWCAHSAAAAVWWWGFAAARRRAIERDRADDAERDAELDELRRLAEGNGHHNPLSVAS
jgi:hypothetical protein